MDIRELICIGCPLGCRLTVTMDGADVRDVRGNTCPRGADYAKKELTHPTRIVTTSVIVQGGKMPMVSVKTKKDIPKDRIFDVCNVLKDVRVQAPVHIGDVVCADVAGTGVDVVATKNVEV